MESRMDQFRDFVNVHPLLREEVRNGRRTWQNIYEEWVLYGDSTSEWNKYTESTTKPKTETANNSLNMDSIKSIVGYVKNINPDSINKTLNTVQRVIQIIQTVGGSGSKTPSIPGQIAGASSMYNDWWD
jgi:hypothetical protein